MSDRLETLVERWRVEAAFLDECSIGSGAAIFRRCADQLERERAAFEIEPLTIEQAAKVSGYSKAHLYRLSETGELPNVGSENAPRVRRCDLPLKGARRREGSDFADELMEARNR